MKNVLRIGVVVASLALQAAAPYAFAALVPDDSPNLYVSGNEVAIVAPVRSDLFAAGRRVSVNQAVGVDAAIAGDEVEINADIGQDLRAAGNSVFIAGKVGGEALVAGRTVRIARTADIAGPLLVAGDEVTIAGTLRKSMKAYASKIRISGDIAGNVRLYAKEIVLMPGATVHGDLFYSSPQALPAEQLARVSGRVRRDETPESVKADAPGRVAPGWFHPVLFFSMLVSGALLALLFPGAVQGTQEAVLHRPLRSLLAGLVLLCAVPPMALLFMITVVGAPIGFGLLAMYPVILMLGYLAVAFAVGRRMAAAMKQPENAGRWRQLGYLALALIVLRLVALIPVLGMLLLFLAWSAGIGSWALWLHDRYRATPPGGTGEAPAWPVRPAHAAPGTP
jgi:cytoskeletal protein CcmA (bactofilin family)